MVELDTANGSSSSVPAEVGLGTHRQGCGTSESVSLAASRDQTSNVPRPVADYADYANYAARSVVSSTLISMCGGLWWLHASHLFENSPDTLNCQCNTTQHNTTHSK